VDFALYLPESWTEDPSRRAEPHPRRGDVQDQARVGVEMIERAIADGLPAGAGAGRQRVWRQLRVSPARALRGSGLRRRLTPYDHGVAPGFAGRRIGDPVAVGDLADAIGRGGFRRVTWREGTKGKMSSRFATERVVLAQDDLVDPSQREAVWLLMEWPHGEKAATDFTATTLPANMSRRQLVRRVKQRWRTERVYEDARESLGWITTRAAPSAAGTTMCPWCWFASRYRRRALQGFSPLGRKNCHAESVASSRPVRTATRPERHFRDSFITVRLAVARVLATWLPPMPLCHRPRSMGPPGAHAREHRRTTPFESVVLEAANGSVSRQKRSLFGAHARPNESQVYDTVADMILDEAA